MHAAANAADEGAVPGPDGPEEPFYRIPASVALERLETDPDAGLTEREARRRLQRVGPNAIAERRRPGGISLLLRQFSDLIVIVLIVAAGLAFYLDDYRGGTILMPIVVINALIGAYQEFKAERVLEMLRTLIRTRATVIREG